MADVPSDVCAQLLVELDEAWQRCFKKLARRPHWKKQGRDFLSLCESHPKKWSLRNSILRFPKLGNLRAVIHRPLEGIPKTCTLKREVDQWFASIVCEIKVPTPIPRLGPLVALDRGVVLAVADSDGRKVPSPQFYSKSLKRLARAQCKLARKEKGSANREKAKLRVAKICRKVSRQREHFVQTLSHRYSKSHGVIAIEKLQIGSMVRANRGLARSILDAGWGLLSECLRYKQAWSGGSVLEVPAHYSSQTCSECGHVDRNSRRSQSEFVCTACGHFENADTNAAKVLKNRAIR